MNYERYIEENKDRQVETLQELISIKSVAEGPVMTKTGEVYPFGKGVQDAFAYTLKIGEELGFEVANADNYGGHIEFGSGEEVVGILAHLDVVPEGDGWNFEPYSGAIVDNYMYGRGTTDDKGPLVSILFAMKALKDAGYTPSRRIRLILGLDEETNCDGMTYYFDKLGKPDFGFTPDGEFPAINGEKGIMFFELAKRIPKTSQNGLSLRSIKGGQAPNMVADSARAVLRADDMEAYDHIKDLAAEFRSLRHYKVNTKGIGKSLEITVEGVSAHGASPEAGLNAISIMMEFLGELNFVSDEVNDFIDFYNQYIGFELTGEKLGCGLCDTVSGGLILNVGKIEYKKEAITLTLNVRYPVTHTGEMVYEAIMPLVNKYNLGVIKLKDKKPVFIDAESPLINVLMDVYKKHTEDYESKPIVMGGGTYARMCPNTVAFGALFPGDNDVMHQANECISLDRLILATKIYTEAIYKLSQANFKL